ncbi:hypothetical protein [Azospirillum sp. B510]|uniref:hypothetical protein n=1 Tax=Azospirillum sp. (strain B510) TaxID=137722 RepID=UPI000302327C|nr:hypothetical protein [Azospirillum sp. B510]
MLHIKDIEAFARINEALNEETAGTQADQSGDAATAPPSHPALVMAMLATGRLTLSALSKTAAAPSQPDVPAPWGRLSRRS